MTKKAKCITVSCIIRKTRGREGQRRRFRDLRPSPIVFSSNFSPETVTFIDKMPTSKFGL